MVNISGKADQAIQSSYFVVLKHCVAAKKPTCKQQQCLGQLEHVCKH